MTIDKKYRNICMWMADGGIEIGNTERGYNNTTAMVYDDGGVKLYGKRMKHSLLSRLL